MRPSLPFAVIAGVVILVAVLVGAYFQGAFDGSDPVATSAVESAPETVAETAGTGESSDTDPEPGGAADSEPEAAPSQPATQSSPSQTTQAQVAEKAAETTSGSPEATSETTAQASVTTPIVVPRTRSESQSAGDSAEAQVATLPDEGTEAQTGQTPPSFDVVRVEKSGEALVAGRAQPGSRVTIFDGDQPTASIVADPSGTWVVLPEEPLAPGTHELTLRAEDPDGQVLSSDNAVIVAVPHPTKPAEPAPVIAGTEPAGEPDSAQVAQQSAPVAEAQATSAAQSASGTPQAAAEPAPAGAAQIAAVPDTGAAETGLPPPEPEGPIAILVPRDGKGPSRVLQQPEPEGLKDHELVLSAVDYGANGRVIISGHAAPGAAIFIYLDNKLLGKTVALDSGRWVLSPTQPIAKGLHKLRVDQVDPNGNVVARIETPFSRAEILTSLPNERFIIVQPGNSLWRIARRNYGEGVQYSVIYQWNKDQIRDPDLIYPGQIFMVPDIN